MVAIRNLYWTDSICAFIVGGLILDGTRCEVSGAAPEDVAPLAGATQNCARLTNRSIYR